METQTAQEVAAGNALELKTQFHTDDSGRMVVERTQDCTAIAENAQALQRGGFTGTSELKHAARIPFVIVEKYCNDHNIEFSEFMQNKEHMRRVLNDPALAYFRVWKGRV